MLIYRIQTRITMRKVFAIMLILFFSEQILGQHCAPIIESWLSNITVNHENKNLNIELEYSKHGGQQKKAYQIYLIAYLEKDEKKVLNESLNNLRNDSLSVILKTGIISRTENGTYHFSYGIDVNKIVQVLKHAKLLKENEKEVYGGYGSYKNKFKLIVFIPFLEDKKYSTLKKLPKDKHECNYTKAKSLLFQALPYVFSVHFGIMQGKNLGKGNYYIQIN